MGSVADLGDASAIMIVVVVLDSIIALLCGGFGAFHLKMVIYNQTTIEVKYGQQPQYDLGFSANMQQVFGANPLLWFIPIYGKGPVGDGIRWPTNIPTPARPHGLAPPEPPRVADTGL